MTLPGSPGLSPSFANVAACVLLAAFLLACNGDDAGSTTGERLLLLEAEAHSLKESLGALHEENETVLREVAALRDENAALRVEIEELQHAQAEFLKAQQAAEAARVYREEVADFEEGQEQQLAALEEGQFRTEQRLGEIDERLSGIANSQNRNYERLRELEDDVEGLGEIVPLVEAWFLKQDQRVVLIEGTMLDRTRRLAEQYGGEVYNIDSREQEERAILVMPLEPIEGNPIIVSLHGYGGNSADHSMYFPLHEHVVSRGFGLLLPNGTPDGEGNHSWNPTDQVSSIGKASEDDFAYLSGLVSRAKELKNFGPVYIFGYSNGGFMAYYLACKGLPGLRAVASLAGTSYVDDSECEGAPPVSVLHIHGKQDGVIRYHGSDQSDAPHLVSGKAYAGAEDMFHNWGERAGCNVQSVAYGLGVDLDDNIEGPETLTYAFPEGCAEGITVELWSSDEGGHTPGYGDVFVDALLDWLLSQE